MGCGSWSVQDGRVVLDLYGARRRSAACHSACRCLARRCDPLLHWRHRTEGREPESQPACESHHRRSARSRWAGALAFRTAPPLAASSSSCGTGCWRDLPRELGHGSGVTCWRRLRAWQTLGVSAAARHTVLNWLGLLDPVPGNVRVWTAPSCGSSAGARQRGPTQSTAARRAASTTWSWTGRRTAGSGVLRGGRLRLPDARAPGGRRPAHLAAPR